MARKVTQPPVPAWTCRVLPAGGSGLWHRSGLFATLAGFAGAKPGGGEQP